MTTDVDALRSKTGANLTCAEIIRALLDALDESRLDVTAAVSGAHLKRMVAQKLSGPSAGGNSYIHIS